jgi:hypothetical protein
MIITGSNSERKQFQIAPAGTHLARLYRIIDLGTQMREFEGKVTMNRKAKFFFELHGEDAEGKPLTTTDGKPLIQSREYTVSLNEKANLRRDLEAWRGKAFTEEDLKGFDLKNIIGHFCMVTISHRLKGDITYADLKGLTAVPTIYKRQGLPEGINSTMMFNIDKFDQNMFDSLSDSIKDTIRKSPEFRSIADKPQQQETVADMSDDIPF